MKKIIIIMFIFLFYLSVVSGATLSYFTSQANEVKVPFTMGFLEMDMIPSSMNADFNDWKPGEEHAQNIIWTFENTGTKDAYIRVKLDEAWSLAEDSTLREQENTKWTLQNDKLWQKGRDDYYYYKDPVVASERIHLSFSIELISVKNFLGAEYSVNLKLEAIQATGGAAFHEWKDSPFNYPDV